MVTAMISVTDKISTVSRMLDILRNTEYAGIYSYQDLVRHAINYCVTGIGIARLGHGSRAIGLIFLDGIPERFVLFDDDGRLSGSDLPPETMQTGYYELYEILKGDLISHPAYPGPVSRDRNGKDALEQLEHPVFNEFTPENRISESTRMKRIILLKTDVNGHIKYLNRFGCRLFGYDEHDVLGKPVIGTIFTESGEKVQEFTEIFKALSKSPGKVRTLNHDVITRDEKTIRIGWSFFAQVDENRCVNTIICTGMAHTAGEKKVDISEESGKKITIPADQLPIMFFVARDGRIIHANDMFLQISGYTQSELTSPGFEIGSLLHPATRLQQEADITRQLEGADPGTVEYSIISRSGERLEILLSTKHIDYAGSKCILCAIFDITERKRAENNTIQSETLYRTILETIGTAAMMVDGDGMIRLVNNKFERIFGYARGDLEGSIIWSDLIAHDESEEIRNFYATHRNMGNSQDSYELRILDAGGCSRDVIMTFSLIPGSTSSVHCLTDITARKAAETKLSESEKRYRLLAENMKDVIWTTDLSLNITYVSPSVHQLLGHSPEDMDQFNIADILTPASRDHALSVFQEVFADIEKTAGQIRDSRVLELECIRKDATNVWVEARVGILRDQNGRVVSLIGIANDISERKNTERIKLEAYEQIEKNMEQFAILNDHIRNPLQAIVGLADLEGGKMAEMIFEQAKEIDAIIKRLDRGWIESAKIRDFIKRH